MTSSSAAGVSLSDTMLVFARVVSFSSGLMPFHAMPNHDGTFTKKILNDFCG